MDAKDYQTLAALTAKLETERDKLVAEFKRRLDETIAAQKAFIAVSGFTALSASGIAVVPGKAPMGHDVPVEHIPGDAFHGKNLVEATERYLEIYVARNSPKTPKEIAAALNQGGFQSKSGDFSNVVGVSLRAALKSGNAKLTKIKGGRWGLKSWYWKEDKSPA